MLKYTKYLILFITIMAVMGCGSDSQPAEESASAEQQQATDAAAETQYNAPGPFLERLEEATEHYLLLSAALVNDETDEAIRYTRLMRQVLAEADSGALGEEALAFWSEQWAIINTRARALEEESEIEAQRYEFEFLSGAIIQLIDGFDPLSFDVYVQRCPMVRDGSADWISREAKILNPYHGDRMLTCGSVVREL